MLTHAATNRCSCFVPENIPTCHIRIGFAIFVIGQLHQQILDGGGALDKLIQVFWKKLIWLRSKAGDIANRSKTPKQLSVLFLCAFIEKSVVDRVNVVFDG